MAERGGGRARRRPRPIPENSITKPPSAELRPGQLDTDSLPDYAVLDAMLDDYVEEDMGAAELVAAGHDPALVDRVIAMVDRAEYKRRQYPPGPKITAAQLRPRPPSADHQPLGRAAPQLTRRHGNPASAALPLSGHRDHRSRLQLSGHREAILDSEGITVI